MIAELVTSVLSPACEDFSESDTVALSSTFVESDREPAVRQMRHYASLSGLPFWCVTFGDDGPQIAASSGDGLALIPNMQASVFQDLRGPNLVIWQSIRRLMGAGVMELDFGKTSRLNEGLRRFKRQWGADERVIRYARYDFARRQFVKTSDLAAGIQARLFALMPVAVSRCLGRAVYPHLS